MTNLNTKKKDLSYSSFDEFQKYSNFDFSKLDFNKPAICNSLLKLHDEGYKYLNIGDDEKAFMLLMRFFEGFVKLRSSKLYKQDKTYVDNFISNEKLNKCLEILENLKLDLKSRYEEREREKNLKNIEDLNSKSEQITENIPTETCFEIDKKFISPKELIDLIKKSIYKILIIDIRPKIEFDMSHMNFNLLLTEEIKKKQLIAHINIPEDLIENVTWNISESLKKVDQQTSILFSDRAQYDYIIIFDKETSLNGLKIDSKISILKRALFEYDLEKVKNEPIILDGGWSQWTLYYPAYKTCSNQQIAGNKSEDDKSKLNVKKIFDFDYPELNENKQQTTIKTIEPSPQTEKVSPEAEKNEPIKLPIQINEVKKEEPFQQVILKPLVDRSNKPLNYSNNKQDQIQNDLNKKEEIKKPSIPVPNRIEKPEFRKENLNTNQNENKTVTNNSRINDVIFNSVYAPSRFNLQFHTPYMKEGTSKVLNNETGIFSYQSKTNSTNNNSENKPTQTITPIPSKTEPIRKEKPKPPTEPTRPQKTGSNLKRTLSSPNIANLEDDIKIENESSAEEEKKFIIKNLNQNSTIEKPSPLIDKPAVNRNSKPISEHVMRSRIEELQPVFGNTHPGLTGIRNLGNTCFMNSVLQCMSNTELLANFFLNGKYKQDLNRKNDLGFRGEIADEFSVIIHSIWGGYCRIISPRRFKYIIGQFNQQFISNEQQDAQELLLFLLDGLHEDLNRVQIRPKLNDKEDENENLSDSEAANLAWNTHLSINNSIIVDLFQGQFKSTVICSFCNKNSIKFDAFMYLTLPILSNKCDVYQCLDLFLQPEKMTGESKWKCPRCKQYRDAIKKIDIWKLPPLLIIHLKRFKYNGMWRDKITTNVDYPIEGLNLEKYILNKTQPNVTNKYKLYAISNHSGTLDGGHYTSMCRNFKFDRWFKFDDSEVKEINDLASLKSAMSYILFYSRY